MKIMCRCRMCGKTYDPGRSRADYTGYCSQACLHAKAKQLGYRKNGARSEYDILRSSNRIGDVRI